ncbi:cyclohexanecarboxylate-CoA ligase [Lipingzhangella halophila]|uniref:Cyclohexanecarboxylate-CoA ligase n=1 Tax=Lipingzhangella halophila TaxID=1783352 RepID=A0A7W7RP40_9ACTN|nr:AMP-binding protein [Lipingzhangella halophila]MBB4935302.1 cyclohexanecarboxylate-CoA ligase [Lipingzhangella halophila]
MPPPKLVLSDTLVHNPAPGQELPLTDAAVEEYRASGLWSGRTLRSLLTDAAARAPEAPALVGHRSGQPGRERLNYREFDERVRVAADALSRLGVREGDAVAVMLPNRVEFPILIFAIAELGAVYVGLPVAYGRREMTAILRRSQARVLVTVPSWRGNSPLSLARELRPELPGLRTIAVVEDTRAAELAEGEVRWADLPGSARHDRPEPSASRLCHLGFTSGTTGEPKGVMNNHEALIAVLERFVEHMGAATFGEPIVQLVASPIGHHSGFLWGILMTVELGGTAVLVDRWDPAEGSNLIREEGVTAMVNAPTFLMDLLETDLAGDPGCPLRTVVLAGAPVPRALPETAGASLGAFVCPAWGMTEYGIAISCAPHLPEQALRTDGVPVPAAQVAVVADDGTELPPGEEGDLLVRGPGLFLGYYGHPDETRKVFTADGWFHTGDRAVRGTDGTVALRGRSKDIIIRGGENIPVAEVENLVHAHPDIVNAAVVGYPDERLGERAAAVVVLREGSRMELAQLCDYLLKQGLSKHHLPERLEIRDELPMTMSGKLRKAELRKQLAAAGGDAE